VLDSGKDPCMAIQDSVANLQINAPAKSNVSGERLEASEAARATG